MRRLMLGLALLLAVGASVWVTLRDEAPEADALVGARRPVVRSGAPAPGAASGAPAPAAPETAIERSLRLRRLAGVEQSDLFAPRSWDPPPPRVKISRAAVQAAEAPPPPPQAPPVPFTYMGKMLDGNDTVAFLTRAGRSYVVRGGDTLDNTYRVDHIDPNQLTMTYLPLNIQQQLALGASQ